MFGSAIIVFRETLEAALLIGIIAAATRGLTGRNLWLAVGVGAGLAGSLVVAGLTETIAETGRRRRAGTVQRRHSRYRRADAGLAQHLDGHAMDARWPRRPSRWGRPSDSGSARCRRWPS